VDPQTAACGPSSERGWLCTTVFRITESESAAEVADALAQPLRIVLIVLLAWLSVHILRRAVTKTARKLRDQPRSSAFRERTTDPTVLDDLSQRRHVQRVDTLATVLRNVISIIV